MIKALVFDLDGTAIPNEESGMPSRKVIKVVHRAKKIVDISIATGRPISNCHQILSALKITNPSVISGGSQIVNPISQKILWERKISLGNSKKIMDICSHYPYQIYVDDALESKLASKTKVSKPYLVIYVTAVNQSDEKKLIDTFKKVKEISAHPVRSWTKGHFDIHITHKEATKNQAMKKLLKIIRHKTEDVMVVGDSDNDLPLFQLAGFKVAMGNATDKLKNAADYVTKSVEEDGLAFAIEEFILKAKK